MSWPPSGDVVVCVPSGTGVGPSGSRGRLLSGVRPAWCCAWLSTECCWLAEEEWEDSVDAVGSCAPCCCPGDMLFVRLLDQALVGGGGGGAPGRGIGTAMQSPGPRGWKRWRWLPCSPLG